MSTPLTPDQEGNDFEMSNAPAEQANKRPRTQTDPAFIVRPSSTSPERLALRKRPVRQNLWVREAEALPAPMPPTVTPPDPDPSNYAYIPALDPAVYSGKPTGRTANPHFQMSRSGPTPPQPLLPHRPFPAGPFVVPPIPAMNFRGNLNPEQLEELERIRRAPGAPIFLALVPHGAGKAMNTMAAEIVEEVEGFLGSLAFEENGRLPYKVVLHPPDARNDGGPNSRPFSKPWPFFLQLPANAGPLRTFLMWQRVFAVSKNASFSVYDLDDDVECWDFYSITGTQIRRDASHHDVLQQKELILAAIKRDLGQNTKYRSYGANMAFRNLQHAGDLPQALETLADTFHLERTEAEDGNGNLIPAYVFMARPPTSTPEEHTQWADFFIRDENRARTAFRIALQRFDIAFLPVRVWCDLCKSRIHCTARCPWPEMEGWLGTTPKDLGVRTTSLNPVTYTGPAGAVVTPLIAAFRRTINNVVANNANAGRGARGGTRGGRGAHRGSRGGRGGPPL